MKIPDAIVAVGKEWKKVKTIQGWQLEKVKSKKEVFLEAQQVRKESPFFDIDGHLSSQECGHRTSVLRGDIVKDDSGAYAVFTEEGSSASQMIAAKVIDVIAILPDIDGQADDAVSADTQVKMEDAPGLLKMPKS